MNQLSKNNSTLLFIILTGVLIVAAFISHTKISQYNKSVETMMQINEVKSKVLDVLSHVKDAEIEQRGFLLTGDSAFLQSYALGEKASNLNFAALDSLIKDARQEEHLKTLKTLIGERYAFLYANLLLANDPLSKRSKDSLLMQGKIKMDEVRAQVLLMLQTEDILLTERTNFRDRTASITPISLLLLSLFSILVISIFFFRLQKETDERISITESNKLLQQANLKIETSEKRFRTLTATIPHMTWAATPEGTKNFFNKYFLDYTGLTFEELDGEGWQSVIFPEDREKELTQWKHALRTGEEFEIEKRVRHHSGEYRWHIARAVPQRDNNGVIIGWIGTSTDISEQRNFTEALELKVKERTKELEAKNIELENANAELESFNYIASHDLQEPLRKIQGFSKRILNEQQEQLTDTAKDYFNRINGAAKRMQNLISSVLSYSRTNNAELKFEKTDLNDTLNEVKIELYEAIDQKNAVIEITSLPTICAIPAQMHQLFLNLISNSLKYSKKDVAPLIKISAEKVIIKDVGGQNDGNSSYWKIIVSDNGIGFEQQYQHKIFEVFQRLHGKTAYEGTGIGLAICKKIIQAHRGTISAIGEIGIGSTFTILLPINEKM